MPSAEKVDRHDTQWVSDARRHTRDVEERIDRAVDRRGGPVDRGRIGQVDLVKLLELQRRPLQVQPNDLGAELGELPRHFGSDTRAAAGDHRAAAVVAPEVVDLSHVLFLVGRCHSVLLTSAEGFLLSQPSPDLSFAAAASMPAFISSIARDTSLAV